jgi:hypothetical protein
MEAEPTLAPAAGEGAGGDADAAPVTRRFTFTPVAGNWADDDEDEKDEDGREGARAAILETLKAKYQHRCAF